MFKKRFVYLYSFLTFQPAVVTTPHGLFYRPGEISSQKTIEFVYENLSWFLNLCQQNPTCVPQDESRNILLKIQEGLPLERQMNPHQLEFLSEKEYKFPTGQQAVTGSKPGSPLRINIDLIYFTSHDDPKELIPMSMGDALTLIVHELGHHYSPSSHETLHTLGAQVGRFYNHHKTVIPMPTNRTTNPFSRDVIFKSDLVNSVSDSDHVMKGPQALLILTDEQKHILLNPILEPYLKCPSSSPASQSMTRSGYIFSDLHWLSWLKGPQFTGCEGGPELMDLMPIEVQAYLLCEEFQDGKLSRQEILPLQLKVVFAVKKTCRQSEPSVVQYSVQNLQSVTVL